VYKATFRINIRKALLMSFVALGPLGNLLTPHFLPSALRTYFFLLPLFPLFFFIIYERFMKIGALFLPLFIYSFVSALLVTFFGQANESHTLFRFFLLFTQFFFILGAVSSLKTRDELISTLKIYLISYSISLAIGYCFYIGYYLKIVPLSILDRFSVLTQFGFSILRFSPGSYPNEYGIVSSFVLSILTILIFEKNQRFIPVRKPLLYSFFTLTFIAFLLTTTRAAYLSFALVLLYLLLRSKNFFRAFLKLSIFTTCLFTFLSFFKFNMFKILKAGFGQKMHQGSLGERLQTWNVALERAKESPIWGTGFASITNVHNVYFQLLFELGAIGTLILILSFLIAFLESTSKYSSGIKDETTHFLEKIRMAGLINVLTFAASNHNLNHHLTWFVFFLCLATLRLPFLKTRQELPTT